MTGVGQCAKARMGGTGWTQDVGGTGELGWMEQASEGRVGRASV
jgi:uncharacterized NAD-dependent epimerase/dehydratase family protein